MNRNIFSPAHMWTRHGAPALSWAGANWKWVIFLIWVAVAAYELSLAQAKIYWLALGDTDDNLRYVQVRDWLAGQGWYDLRQYRLDPPGGANIHWSRIVDLPIAALMLFFRLFVSDMQADRMACALAPLLPLLPMMWALAFVTRRLSDGPAWLLAPVAVLAAPMGLGMYVPLRIDHHGWQLALALTMLAGIVDRKWVRGGLVAGLSSAMSLAIGMEMIVYLAAGGGLIALRWVFKPGAARRMLPYALSLGAGVALFYLVFASEANRAPMCDALSPVWVAAMGLAAGGMVALALLPLPHWYQRLGAGALAGAVVAAYMWLNWPQCVSGAYQISPELVDKWLSHIREAKPVTNGSWSEIWRRLALPGVGAAGALAGCWLARRDVERLWAWGTVGLMTLFALGLTFWQLRAVPAAQMLAIPAASWAVMAGIRLAVKDGRLRPLALVPALICAAVAFFPGDLNRVYGRMWPAPAPSAQDRATADARKARRERIRSANAKCRTLPALRRLDRLPPATILTMVDLGPRLLATTHHSAIAGPYHRNGEAILDLHHAFDGTDADFLTTARRHRATYFLFCPDFPEGTVYQARSPDGFYARIARGWRPGWLVPVDLGTTGLPYQLFRIDWASAPLGEKGAQQGR